MQGRREEQRSSLWQLQDQVSWEAPRCSNMEICKISKLSNTRPTITQLKIGRLISSSKLKFKYLNKFYRKSAQQMFTKQ